MGDEGSYTAYNIADKGTKHVALLDQVEMIIRLSCDTVTIVETLMAVLESPDVATTLSNYIMQKR